MSLTLKTWTGFSKRINSTKQPTSGTDLTVKLKEGTSITAPTFLCSTVGTNVNYVYSASWGRYYFVRDAVQVTADQVELRCSVDAMASYKSQIGSYSGYIEYAASSSNLVISDPRNQPTQLVSATNGAMSFSTNYFNATGCYIIGVLSDHSNGQNGIITYYALTTGEMQLFTAELYDQTFIQRLVDQFQAVQDSLVSCVWIPIDISHVPGTSGMKIHIGREIMDAEGKKVASRKLHMATGSVSLTFPSGAGGGGDMLYIDKAPYTTATMFLPFVGVVPIDVDMAAFTKNMAVDAYIDLITGDIVYKVSYGGAMTSTFNGNIATKMPTSSATYDAVGAATGTLAAIGGVIGVVAALWTGGSSAALMAAGGAAAGGAIGTAKSLELHTMTNGTASSAIGAELGLNPWYAIYTYVPATGATSADLLSFQSEQGMPYCKTDTISNLSGFVKCAAASVSIPGTEAEKETVNSMMNSGFYYE